MKDELLAVLSGLPDPFLGVDSAWRITFLNAQAAAYLGLRSADLVGADFWTAFPEAVGTRFEQVARRVMTAREVADFEAYHPAWNVWLEARVFPQGSGLGILYRDVTHRKRAEERARRLLDVAGLLARANDASDVARIVMQHAGPNTGGFASSLFLVSEDGEHLELLAYTGYAARDIEPWKRFPLRPGTPLGDAILSGRALHLDRETYARRYPSVPLNPNTHASALLPLVARDRALGGLIVSFEAPDAFNADEEAFLAALADQCALALDRARAVALTRDSEERLRLAVDAAQLGIWEWRIHDNNITWSERLERIYGLPIGGFDGRYETYHSLLHPADRDMMTRTIQNAVRDRSEYVVEHRIIRGDGQVRWIEGHGKVYTDASGVPTRVLGTAGDITRRKDIEQQLRAAKEELEARVAERTRELTERNASLQAFASFTEAVGSATDLPLLAQRAVEVVAQAFGEGSAVYYEQRDDVWVGVAWAGNILPGTLELIRSGVPLSEVADFTQESGALFFDGWEKESYGIARRTTEYGTAAFFPIRVPGHQPALLTGGLTQHRRWPEGAKAVFRAVGRALTLAAERAQVTNELVQQRAELLSANEELEAFAYSVSHDLRTPIRHIASFTGLLRRRRGDALGAEGARYLNMIEDASKHMNALTEALLSFSRLSRQDVQFEPVSLTQITQNAWQELTLDQGDRVRWVLGELPTVACDRVLIRLVLTNLLSNALKFTRHQRAPRVEVWADVSPGEVTVHVRDNGAGFDMQHAAKLFAVFQRLHRTDEYEGIGIGLANVRRIITRHGGRVWATGEIGQGATFSFTLPAHAARSVT